MSGLAILLALTAPGLDYGWQPSGTGLEFIIQLEAPLAQSVATGGTREDIVSAVPPDLAPSNRQPGLRSVRIIMGQKTLPRSLSADTLQRRLPPYGVKEVLGDVRSQGWQPAAGGGFEYIIELLPVQAQALARGEIELIHELNPEVVARGIRAFRVRMTNAPPPRGGLAQDADWSRRTVGQAASLGAAAGSSPGRDSTIPTAQQNSSDYRDSSTVPTRPPASPLTDPDYLGQSPPSAAPPVDLLAPGRGAGADPYAVTPPYGVGNGASPRYPESTTPGGAGATDDDYFSQARQLQQSTRQINQGLNGALRGQGDYLNEPRPAASPYDTSGGDRDLFARPNRDRPLVGQANSTVPPNSFNNQPLADPNANQAPPAYQNPPLNAATGAPNGYPAPPTPNPNPNPNAAANATDPYGSLMATTPMAPGMPILVYPQQLAALTAAHLQAAQNSGAASSAKDRDEPSRSAELGGEAKNVRLAGRGWSDMGLDPNAPRPWMPLVMTTLALFASLGANAYLSWVAWSFYERYRDLLLHVRER